ncbi:MAG: YHYH protein [Oceanobacter sp.]
MRLRWSLKTTLSIQAICPYQPVHGDLDECNGCYGVTPEYPEGIYHYYITDDYPYIARCVHGDPDSSFRVMMGG